MPLARRAAAVAVGVLALALLPSTALGSSIVFIKDNNVWLTSPDGSRQLQVTKDGTATTAYNWPSQADDGTILAKRGNYFVRLRPDGRRIGNPIPAIGSDTQHSGNLFLMSGPNTPRISPDGTRFAYWLSVRNIETCPVFDPHNCSFRDTDYTLVSRVDRFTPGQEFGAVRDYRDPSWVGNTQLAVFNYGLHVKQGAIARVGSGEAGLVQWFDPPAGTTQMGQGQFTRKADKLVTLAGDEVFGPAQRELHFYGVTSYPTPPESKCYVPAGAPPSGKFLIPTWSPDGTAVAVGESDGIHVYENIPDLNVPDADCHEITDRVLVAGSAPAWGPANVPGTPSPRPPEPDPGPDPGPDAEPMTALAIAPRQQGRAVRVRLRVLTAGAKVRVRLKAGRRGKVVGRKVVRRAAAGDLALEVRLSRRGRAALRRRGTLRLAVAVTVTAPGGARASRQRRVTLRR